MISFQKHIAVLLYVIFIFPIAYQPFHIVWHHSHDSHAHHDCCHADEEKEISSIGINVSSDGNKHCPVCEYHFPINDLPKVSLFRSVGLSIERYLCEIEIRLPLKQVVSNKSPRAPPLLDA